MILNFKETYDSFSHSLVNSIIILYLRKCIIYVLLCINPLTYHGDTNFIFNYVCIYISCNKVLFIF